MTNSKQDHEVKKMIKLGKRKYEERQAVEAEEVGAGQHLKTLYRINKMLNIGFKNNNVPVKDIDGNVLSNEAGRLTRWKEHFESILNWPEPEQVAHEIPQGLGCLHRCTYHERGESCHQSHEEREEWLYYNQCLPKTSTKKIPGQVGRTNHICGFMIDHGKFPLIILLHYTAVTVAN